MADWCDRRLGEIVEVLDSRRVPVREEDRPSGCVPYYGANGQLGWIDRSLFDESLILLAEDGGHFEEFADRPIAYRIDGPSWVNNHAHVLRAIADVSQDYVFWSLRNKDIRHWVAGGTRSKLTRAEMERIEITLPPLEEQRRIAEILDTIDETIQATERVIAKHKRIRSGLASDLLEVKSVNESLESRNLSGAPLSGASRLTRRNRVGDVVFLRDCGRWLSGGTPDTGNLNYWGGEIPWITSSSLKGRYLSASQRRLTLAGADAGSRIVPGGTILFVVRGMSLKKEFRVGMTVRPVAFGQDCKALVPADGIDPKYLLFALEAAENRVLRMVDEASHGTGRLQTSLLGGLKVRLPPIEKQRRVIEVLNSIDDAIRNNRAELQKLRRTSSGLANDLLSGRVRTVAA